MTLAAKVPPSELDLLRVSDVDLDREIVVRDGFWGFVQVAWPLVEPRPLLPNWHIRLLADHLEAVTRGECRRLVVNVPPGTGKSLVVSALWPAWDWIRDPGIRTISASYDPTLSRRDAKRTLELVQSPWFQARWPHVAVRGRDPAPTEYATTAGGFRYATSVRGRVTGRHADRHVVDDPIKPSDLAVMVSGAALELVLDWWRGTMASRAVDLATLSQVIIMQRLHDLDLAGYVLANEADWTHLCLPMRFEAARKCRTKWGEDPRREEGEILHPARFPGPEVAKLKRDAGDLVWAAQYQQTPVDAQGGIFQDGQIQTYDTVPELGRAAIVVSWDLAFKGLDSSDFVAGQVWAKVGADFYLLESIHRRLTFTETVQAVRDMATRWPGRKILVEDKANGPAVIDTLQREIPGLEAVPPKGGKIVRAHAVSPIFASRHVFVPAWATGFVSELLRFPRAAHDDQVDAATQALDWLVSQGAALARWEAMFNRMKHEG